MDDSVRQDNDIHPRDEGPERDGPAARDDGVDVSLIRWMLSLSPADRLRVLQGNVRSIVRLRHGARRC